MHSCSSELFLEFLERQPSALKQMAQSFKWFRKEFYRNVHAAKTA
jgi:hypothetical protein